LVKKRRKKMADVVKLAPIILKWEGGFVNDPDDLGGATNKGITIATYMRYRKANRLPQPAINDLKSICSYEWMDILKTMYWDRWRADKIVNQAVANILVDWVWASGIHGIKRPQRMLGVKDDGVAGTITLDALNSYPNQQQLFNRIKADRITYIDEICIKRPANNKFKKGWLNRLNDFKFQHNE
jgi:lysozyme family protein